MVADRSKKPKTADKLAESAEEDNIHNDKDLLVSLEKLQDFQNELDKVNEEASDKVLEVERKYNEIRRPVYVRRNEIISSIPDFWLTAVAEIIKEDLWPDSIKYLYNVADDEDSEEDEDEDEDEEIMSRREVEA